ncbi:putative PHD finger domain protein [Aspergillus stella-maris]|uniref:putative PHD finger domain protein n=1 Tax=Aspergillus stella-maris TaxID=1810926 RepID=UPI003CCE4890
MARNLRSSSHARSNDSRPSTPARSTPNMASSFTESTRPRKQRRTGRTSRVATDPLRDTPVSSQSQPDQHDESQTNGVNGTNSFGEDAEWKEPELRAPVPSYDDTPWSAVSSSVNPVLGTMRPLGALPTAADLRKVGLVPSKPGTPSIAPRKEPQLAVNGEKKTDNPPTPLTPAEEQPPELIIQKPSIEDDLAAFTVLPVPNSADADGEMLKSAFESALHLASDADNRPVFKSLLRFWEKCGNDPMALSTLDGVCHESPDSSQRSMFQEVMRSAWNELQSQEVIVHEHATLPVPARARSASSVSTLSSAKSLDAETYAPAVVSAAPAVRHRKGKHAKNAAQKKNVAERRSVLSGNGSQRQRALDDPDFSAEAVQAKRSRLRKSLPKIVAMESGIRSSLASKPRSILSSPGPSSIDVPAGEAGIRRGRSESVASSDAGDNRRLTPSLTDDEPADNNDYCRNCGKSGQLLCCDGCVLSFHFSCLDPPLDPANPPEGDWYCPKCSISQSLNTLMGGFDKVSNRDFALPPRIRDFFAGVRTGDDGKYEEIAQLPRINPRAARGSRVGRYDDPFLLRTIDAKGNLIFCVKCGRTTNGRRPIIQCDFCPCAFHMDCVDPPLAVPPTQRAGSDRPYHTWMCPNHALHDMHYTVKDEEGYETIKRIRRPKAPRYVDIEILPEPDQDDNLEDQEEEGVTYRVSEKGVKLDFIQRVKSETENLAAKKAASNQYFEYAKTQFDNLTSKAEAFYASQKPYAPEEETTTAILNSRTVAEREAAANLISFAQGYEVTWQGEESGRISLLIDQLKANEPKNTPLPETEIESLQALQRLIEQRISALKPQDKPAPAPAAQPESQDEAHQSAPTEQQAPASPQSQTITDAQ